MLALMRAGRWTMLLSSLVLSTAACGSESSEDAGSGGSTSLGGAAGTASGGNAGLGGAAGVASGGSAGQAGAAGSPPKPGTALETPDDCTGERPTWIGGTIFGYPDNRSLNALIGVDHKDGTGAKIDEYGVPCGTAKCCGGYAWCFHVNPSLPAEGSPDATLEQKWGKCVTSKVTEAFIELYPKDPAGKTSLARYGEAAHHYQPITPGKPNDIVLRLPLAYEIDEKQGNTGNIDGYVTCAGKPVAPTDVTRVRAWSEDPGPDCGVQGFSASAHVLETDAAGKTYYRIDYLAGGQCNAAFQHYRLYMDVNCGGQKLTQKKYADIVKGKTLHVDWAF
jgi:hypothetical protein